MSTYGSYGSYGSRGSSSYGSTFGQSQQIYTDRDYHRMKSRAEGAEYDLKSLQSEHTKVLGDHKALKKQFHEVKMSTDTEYATTYKKKRARDQATARKRVATARKNEITARRQKTMKSNKRKQKINKVSGGLFYKRKRKGKTQTVRKGRRR